MHKVEKSDVKLPQNLGELSLDSKSSIKKISSSIILLLNPMYQINIENGVKTELNSRLKTYWEEFSGILLGYEDIKISSPVSWLFDVNPYMHIKISGQFYVFNPTVGSILQGKVVKKSPNHVGCLVHGIFNVSCSIPSSMQRSDWCGSTVSEGDLLEITLTEVNLTSLVPYLKADISESCSNSSTRTVFEDDSGISCSEKSLCNDSLRKKKKKKSKSCNSTEADISTCTIEDNEKQSFSKESTASVSSKYKEGGKTIFSLGTHDIPVKSKKDLAENKQIKETSRKNKQSDIPNIKSKTVEEMSPSNAVKTKKDKKKTESMNFEDQSILNVKIKQEAISSKKEKRKSNAISIKTEIPTDAEDNQYYTASPFSNSKNSKNKTKICEISAKPNNLENNEDLLTPKKKKHSNKSIKNEISSDGNNEPTGSEANSPKKNKKSSLISVKKEIISESSDEISKSSSKKRKLNESIEIHSKHKKRKIKCEY